MSGGRFDYKQSQLAEELFGWGLGFELDYGEEGWKNSTKARKLNPLEDREISEIAWDLLCLIHSFDYYRSGDTSYDTYAKDLEHFKNKWMKRTDADRVNEYKNDLKEYFDELMGEFDRIFLERS